MYISAQWAVHEGQIDSGGHLFERGVIVDVRPDPPVLLPQDLVVDPAAAGRLEQGVIQEQEKAPTGGEDPGDLPIHGSIGSMCSITRHITTASNAARPARQVVGDGACIQRPTTPLLGHSDLRPSRIQPDHASSNSNRPPRDLPLTTPDVEHPPHTGEVVIDQRKNLLLVFRVGTIRELASPPFRVLLPEGRIIHIHRAILTHAATVPSLDQEAPVEVTSSLRGRPLAEKAANGSVRLASQRRLRRSRPTLRFNRRRAVSLVAAVRWDHAVSIHGRGDIGMDFVQILEFKTSKFDEIEIVARQEYRAKREAAGAPVPVEVLQCKDRDQPNTYVSVVRFSSYEAAMESSTTPTPPQWPPASPPSVTAPPSSATSTSSPK